MIELVHWMPTGKAWRARFGRASDSALAFAAAGAFVTAGVLLLSWLPN